MGDSDLSGGMKCVRWLLLIFNLIFFAGGVAILGVGAYLKVKFGDFVDILDEDWANAPNLLIAAGSLIAVLAFLGCFGAWCESRCLLYIFACLLFVTFILELAAGALAVVYRDDVEDNLQKVLNDTIMEYKTSKPVRKSWDNVQEELECCGVDNSSSWMYLYLNTSVPTSCCSDMAADCNTMSDTLYEQGCYTKLVDWFDDNYVIVGAVAIVLACIQLLGIVFGCCLARALAK